MTAQHSPGPWSFNYDDDVEDANGERVAACRNDDDEVQEANARLIAAAPDLLTALMRVAGILDSAESNASGNLEYDYVGPRVVAARAAISKATGNLERRQSA